MGSGCASAEGKGVKAKVNMVVQGKIVGLDYTRKKCQATARNTLLVKALPQPVLMFLCYRAQNQS